MKKILYILHSTIMGGATISFINLVRGVVENGCEIIVVIPSEDTEFQNRIEELGGHCIVTKLVPSYYRSKERHPKNPIKILKVGKRIFKTYIKKALSYYNLKKIVQKECPDIIHTNVGVIQEGFRVAKKMNIPHVWHLREYQDLDFDMQVLPNKKSFCNMLSQSYVLSITDDILRYFNLQHYNRAKTIYNGILYRDEVFDVMPKQKYFLCASRISPEKGFDETIKVFAKFFYEHPDYRLKILGFGNDIYIASLKKLAEEQKCASAIDWEGFKENVTDYMKNARALLVNSQFEGFGRMTAEACFCNCLVIGRNTGGTKEILEKTGGLLYDTSSQMLQHMNNVANMADKDYQTKSHHACSVARSIFSIENNIEQILELYQQILHPSS